MAIIVTIFILASPMVSADLNIKSLARNGMMVNWYHRHARLYFQVMAPTNGWVAIGFNESSEISNTYLLMGRVVSKKAEVIEHYTIGPGNYQAIAALGGPTVVRDIQGHEAHGKTTIMFSIPVKAASQYQKNFDELKPITMLLAFSREDDFQHHSIMRTTELINTFF